MCTVLVQCWSPTDNSEMTVLSYTLAESDKFNVMELTAEFDWPFVTRDKLQ